MSWAEDDWTVGLSGRVLQKVKELQVHQERLSRENKQKQLQLDNIHASLEKQTVKYEEVRAELLSAQRELQGVRDEAKAAATNSQRLSQDIQSKQAQVCSLEGQLDASRTVNNKLTQEIKRLEAELEKLQNSSRHADAALFSTPCWSAPSNWEHSGSRNEERDDGQGRSHHIRQRLQFSDVPSASSPRQPSRSTPHRHPSDQSDIFSTPSATFPWERDDSRPGARRRSPSSPQTPAPDTISQGPSGQGASEREKELRKQIDTSMSQMQSRVAALEEELRAKAESLKSIQTEMAQSKKSLAATEANLQRSRDELSLAHTRMAQESERTSAAEQRLKQLQEELKCQRQNAESSRLQHQQRTKELEKQHQRDVTELQKERQILEKQHQQEVNKLNQELQQARTLHNALQAQADKLSLQKQALDKELETLKEKLKWTEGQLQESQKKAAQTQAKLTEAQHEAEGVAVTLEQSRKRERALEEEGKRLADERADALRLLKELQEEKAASVPVQPFQYCPVGQSFSPQPSGAHLSRPSTHTKRPATSRPEQRRDKAEEEETHRADVKASYPTDREPGEGIDSEHIRSPISPDSESLQKRGDGGRNDKDRGELTECDSSGANPPSSFDPPISASSQPDTNAKALTEAENGSATPSADKTSPGRDANSGDLQRENAALRSELRDVREELQKRLDDLEAQRRAEAEARTRLKQLSRKHASQSAEKQGLEKEWRTQLEREKAETERLRTALSTLDLELKREREEREQKMEDEGQDEAKKMLEDRESEMAQLNIQLAEVKAQLALERETRRREEEERNLITNTERDEKLELDMQLAELRAELEELRQSRNEDSLKVEKLSLGNSPLAYLTLHGDQLNSNFIGPDAEPLPSPEQHLLLCRSTNQHNTLVSQAAPELPKEAQTLIDPERSPRSDEDTTRGPPISSPYDLMKEVERLRRENAKETERADECQVKLKVLQNQVTRQTKQLTTAFEKQSQHISGLLAELQEKESSLQSQEEELQGCRKELDALKAGKPQEEKSGESEEVEEHMDHTEQTSESAKLSELLTNEQTDSADPVLALTPSNVPATATSRATRPSSARQDASSALAFLETPQISVDSGCADDSTCLKEELEEGQDSGSAALLLALQQENRLLKDKIALLTSSGGGHVAVETVPEEQEDPNTGSSSRSCSEEEEEEEEKEEGAPSVSSQTQASPLPGMRSEDEGRHSEREDVSTEEEVEEVEEVEEPSPLQINHLEQQVAALQTRIRALCKETQEQAEELAIWRLASQPAPAFDPVRPGTDPPEMQQKQEVSPPPGQVAVIREDELFLSCSSNKLQSRVMFTSLQHNSLPEPSVTLSKKSPAFQEYNLDTDEGDKESDKENQEISASLHKDKRHAELIQTPAEKTRQHLATKEPHKVGKGQTKPKAAACHADDPDAKNEAKPGAESSVRSVSSQTEEGLCPRGSQVHSKHTQTPQQEEEEEEEEEELVDSPPVSPLPPLEGRGTGDKILFSGSFPIPADPARLAERIRRNRTQLSAAFDDTEYEPYGLPEVVMKGFADIPTGPSCPYIVRRGLLGTAVLPASLKVPEEEETD